MYNDDQYQVKLARPALVKDEPVYANNKPEHYAVSTKYPDGYGGAISKVPATSPRNMFSTSTTSASSAPDGGPRDLAQPAPEDRFAGISQRDVVLSKRAEELLAQERHDEELALRLQQELNVEEDNDARLAREAQDREYAKMLQQREKAKLKRAKERSKAKKIARQAELESAMAGAAAIGAPVENNLEPEHARSESRVSGGRSSRHSNHHTPQRSFDNSEAVRNGVDHDDDEDDEDSVVSAPGTAAAQVQPPARRPYMNTGAIDSHRSAFAATAGNNIVDSLGGLSNHHFHNLNNEMGDQFTEPQYANVGPGASGPPPPMNVTNRDQDGLPIPPYMPMQQPMSKKSSSLEKRIKKKKEKEGCKQQ